MKRSIAFLAIVCVFTTSDQVLAENRHRIGAGAHYWYTIDDIDVEEIDEDGLGWIISYQFVPTPIFKLEADVEAKRARLAARVISIERIPGLADPSWRS